MTDQVKTFAYPDRCSVSFQNFTLTVATKVWSRAFTKPQNMPRYGLQGVGHFALVPVKVLSTGHKATFC